MVFYVSQILCIVMRFLIPSLTIFTSTAIVFNFIRVALCNMSQVALAYRGIREECSHKARDFLSGEIDQMTMIEEEENVGLV